MGLSTGTGHRSKWLDWVRKIGDFPRKWRACHETRGVDEDCHDGNAKK
jgi:hypothetical protein